MISIRDVMVGDYLQNTNGNVGKVIGIYPFIEGEPEVIMEYHEGNACYSDAKVLQPIPLTAETLEKNGFEYKNGIWVKKGPVRLGWYEKKKELIIGYHTMPIIVEFVHTLQHIIRLLGLEEDIVL